MSLKWRNQVVKTNTCKNITMEEGNTILTESFSGVLRKKVLTKFRKISQKKNP